MQFRKVFGWKWVGTPLTYSVLKKLKTMALVRCKSCGYKGSVGCMPTATCGVLVIGGTGLGIAPTLAIINKALADASLWIKIPTWAAGVAVGGMIGMLAIHYIPWSIEWVIAMCHTCPECKKRKWSFPFTEGFGL